MTHLLIFDLWRKLFLYIPIFAVSLPASVYYPFFSSRRFIGEYVLLRFILQHLASSIYVSTHLLSALKHFRFFS